MNIILHKSDLPDDLDLGNLIAVDGEFMGLNIRRDPLCLIQISTGNSDAHIIQLNRNDYKAPNLVKLLNEQGLMNLKFGKLDTTFFRDDYRRNEKPLNANQTEMNQSVEGMDVVFIDDVLYTGRSIRSALTAIDTYGRPNSIELLVLIDRRFSRHLPIQPDYLGAQVDALQGDKVRVIWSKNSAKNIVYLEKSSE